MGDSKFTACHSNSFSVSGDVLALEANGLKPVGSSLVDVVKLGSQKTKAITSDVCFLWFFCIGRFAYG